MKIEILSPVEFNGKRLDVGTTVEMGRTDAAPLIELGAAAPYDKAAAAANAAAAAEATVAPAE